MSLTFACKQRLMLLASAAGLMLAAIVAQVQAQTVNGPQIAPANGPNAAAPRAETSSQQAKPTAAPLPAVEERMQLKQLTAEQFHTRIEQAFGRTLPPMTDDSSGWLRFAVSDGQGTQVLVAAHQKTREVRMVGRPDQLRGWKQIVATMDAPAPASGGNVTQLIAADKAAAPKIKQTVGVLLAQAQAPRTGQRQQQEQSQQQPPEPNAVSTSLLREVLKPRSSEPEQFDRRSVPGLRSGTAIRICRTGSGPRHIRNIHVHVVLPRWSPGPRCTGQAGPLRDA